MSAKSSDHQEVVLSEGPIPMELRQFEFVYTRTGVPQWAI